MSRVLSGTFHEYRCPHGCASVRTYEPNSSESGSQSEYDAAWERWYTTTSAMQDSHVAGVACAANRAVTAKIISHIGDRGVGRESMQSRAARRDAEREHYVIPYSAGL